MLRPTCATVALDGANPFRAGVAQTPVAVVVVALEVVVDVVESAVVAATLPLTSRTGISRNPAAAADVRRIMRPRVSRNRRSRRCFQNSSPPAATALTPRG